MANPGYVPAPLGGSIPLAVSAAADRTWVRRIVEVVNRILTGKLNVILPVTLSTGATTTTVTDERISYYSALILAPTTQNAAAIWSSIYPTNQKSGSVTLNHLNTAETDCTFNLVILG